MKNAPLILALVALGVALYAAVRSPGVKEQTRVATGNEIAQVEMRALRQDVTALKSQLAALTNRIGSQAARAYQIVHASEKAGAAQPDNSMTLLDDAVGRLEQIVETTGLEQLATNDVAGSQALHDLVSEYAERKAAEKEREMLLAKNGEQHKADSEKYDKHLQELYDKAHARGGRGGGGGTPEERQKADQERQKAVDELATSYPDSYATAMVLAESAVGASFRGDTATMEKYYQQLNANPKAGEAVTDWGVQALPSVEYMLASRYTREGRTADAETLLNDLEKKYPASMLVAFDRQRGNRGGPPTQSAATAAAALRSRINSPK